MKLLYLTTVYPDFARVFYGAQPGQAGASSSAQQAALEAEAYGWAGVWGPSLEPHGIKVQEVWLNLDPMQRAWAREHGGPRPDATREDLAVARARHFEPDVLWYDHLDPVLLARLRAEIPSIRAALGWIGSALPDVPLWRSFDLVLSCAPDSVAVLERRGARAALLQHGFNPRVLDQLEVARPDHAVSFIGQLDPDHPLHGHREQLLDTLLARNEVAVFSPARARDARLGWRTAKRAAWHTNELLRRAGVPEGMLRRIPLTGRATAWPCAPRAGLPARLARALRPPRYGLAMYQLLRNSRVTLNVHAGAATRFTSNMRLFEATGVGTCLLTDAAENLSSLFEPDREVATFRSVEECVEKVAWLLAHEDECAQVARAGQARCLADHTYERRGGPLAALVRSALR